MNKNTIMIILSSILLGSLIIITLCFKRSLNKNKYENVIDSLLSLNTQYKNIIVNQNSMEDRLREINKEQGAYIDSLKRLKPQIKTVYQTKYKDIELANDKQTDSIIRAEVPLTKAAPLFLESGDTLTCYNITELKSIGTRVVRANECEVLLRIDDTIISTQDSVIANQEVILESKDIRLVEKDNQLTDKEKKIAKLMKQYRWTTAGLVGVIGVILLL